MSFVAVIVFPSCFLMPPKNITNDMHSTNVIKLAGIHLNSFATKNSLQKVLVTQNKIFYRLVDD